MKDKQKKFYELHTFFGRGPAAVLRQAFEEKAHIISREDGYAFNVVDKLPKNLHPEHNAGAMSKSNLLGPREEVRKMLVDYDVITLYKFGEPEFYLVKVKYKASHYRPAPKIK